MTLTGFFTFGVSPRGTKSTVAPSSEDARTCFAANLKKWILLYKLNNNLETPPHKEYSIFSLWLESF